jgi:hypothetical protein
MVPPFFRAASTAAGPVAESDEPPPLDAQPASVTAKTALAAIAVTTRRAAPERVMLFIVFLSLR